MLNRYGIDENGKLAPDLNDILEAKKRISPYIRRTPLLAQPKMDKVLGCKTYLKPENLQYVGAFKLRGALNKILSLTKEEQQRGIITSSSGNHAQACAYAGEMLGIPATVVIPKDAPSIKVENARDMGANVILWERTYNARWDKIQEEVKEHNYTIVHPYEDPMVMAGQGTIALEILEDLPNLDVIIVPIGGGGLISGVSTAIKAINPRIRVIGVQPENSAVYLQSREAGKRLNIEPQPTVADGLACRDAGANTYPIIEKNVDEIVAVNDEEIMEAVRFVANKAKLLVEPSSVVGIAALMSKKVKVNPEDHVAHILTSGNWNLEDYAHLFLGEEVNVVD